MNYCDDSKFYIHSNQIWEFVTVTGSYTCLMGVLLGLLDQFISICHNTLPIVMRILIRHRSHTPEWLLRTSQERLQVPGAKTPVSRGQVHRRSYARVSWAFLAPASFRRKCPAEKPFAFLESWFIFFLIVLKM